MLINKYMVKVPKRLKAFLSTQKAMKSDSFYKKLALFSA